MSNSNLGRAEAAARKSLLTIHNYDVKVDISNAKNLEDPGFRTQSTITFDCSEPGASTFLDFIGLGVESVELNGIQLDPAAVVDDARIALPQLAANNTVVVVGTAAYSSSGEGLHRFQDPADHQIYTYTQYEPADSRRVFANFEQPDLKAPFSFTVTAPAGWEVASNQSVVSYTDNAVDEAGAALSGTWEFAPTLPISTYITTILAGPYFKAEDTFSMVFGPASSNAGTELTIPMAAYCRYSMAADFDSQAIFDVTKAGLAYFNELFDYPYPFGKYDQAFVPEYNLGAMENPGLVTFTEAYVYSSRATDSQYQQRANTIMHEMAHMWFGDLVTMSWWDDLWLKESFADFMGHLAVAEATDWGKKSWTLFASKRKVWAYVQDQLPTTHPIVADIPNLEAAKQNFDGITYAKGASVLKQLVAYVGQDKFIQGARDYFKAHEYSNTTLADLLAPLSAASGRDLGDWSAQWLQTAGISSLTPVLSISDGVIDSLTIEQQGTDPLTGAQTLRPHRVGLGLYNYNDAGKLLRTDSVTLDVAGANTAIEAFVGKGAPALLIVNDEDYSYAKVRLDETSLETALASVGKIEDPLARSLVWSSLWNMVRDALLPAANYIATVGAQAAGEPDVALLQSLADNSRTALGNYVPAAQRQQLKANFIESVLAGMNSAVAGSDEQLVWARTFALLARGQENAAPKVRELLEGSTVPAGLSIDSELRWLLLEALASSAQITVPELDAELSANRTAKARASHQLASAAIPNAAVKAEAWREAVEESSLSNELLGATIEGFMEGSQELLAPYVEPYFAAIEKVWTQRSIEIAGRIVRGLFPRGAVLGSEEVPETHPLHLRTQAWLAANPYAARGLRRIILEEDDSLLRSLRAQAAGN